MMFSEVFSFRHASSHFFRAQFHVDQILPQLSSFAKTDSKKAANFMAESSEKEAKRLQVHKQTRLCKFFAAGACTRGAACTFAHGQQKLQQQPDYSKTKLCAQFMEVGSCTAGDACKFAHGKTELRQGSTAKKGRSKGLSPCPTKPGEVGKSVLQQSEAAKGLHQLPKQFASEALKLMKPEMSKAGGPVLANESNEAQGAAFSRQSTCEGVENACWAFSRATSRDESESEFLPVRAQCACFEEFPNVEVEVKNTFIEFRECGDDVAPKRTQSLPIL